MAPTPRLAVILWPDRGKGPWQLRVKWGLVDGRYECVELALRNLEGHAITTAALRGMRIQERVTEARESTFGLVPKHRADTPRQKKKKKKSRIRPSYSRQHYEQVAEIYRNAFKLGAHPQVVVADQLNLTRSTAGNQIARARALGLLGEAPANRRAGEVKPRKSLSEGELARKRRRAKARAAREQTHSPDGGQEVGDRKGKKR
jgi:hypothetical protein